MRKKQRKLAILILSVFLVGLAGLPAWAEAGEEEPAAAAQQETGATTLTLEEAIAMAAENNPQIKQAAAQRELVKIVHEKTTRAARDIPSNVSITNYEMLYVKTILPETTRMNLEQAEKYQANALNLVEVQAESAYYNLMKAEEKLAIAQRSLERAEEQLRLANVRLQAGMASQIEVMQAEAAMVATQAGLLAAGNDLNQQRRALNQVLVLNMDTIIHTNEVINFQPETYDLLSLMAAATEKDQSLMQARISHEIAEWTYNESHRFYGNTWDVRENYQNMIIAESNLQTAKDTLMNKVRSSYERYLSVEEQHRALSKVLELRQEAYRLQQLKYEVGMSTFEEVNKSADELKTAEADLAECIYNYNVLKTSLKYNVYM